MTGLKNFPYFFKEAFKSLCRNGWMSLASIAVVAVTLFLLGAFLLVNYNVNFFAEGVKDQVEIVVYLDDISPAEREALRIHLIGLEEIQEVRFVSKREAMERLKASMGDRASYLEDYENDANNPLPDSFEVKTVVPEDVPVVAQNIRKLSGVDRVDYGEGFVERLFELTRGVKLAAFVFMLSLGITAVFLIANTI
ncbi:MAG TPA: ABC transporter permease, partial [Firmicutes bacterium]|nr:ABC transporter permease [Bacillota bacterium]